jgi:hypothetical protein
MTKLYPGYYKPCPDCSGHGKDMNCYGKTVTCPSCDGSKVVPVNERGGRALMEVNAISPSGPDGHVADSADGYTMQAEDDPEVCKETGERRLFCSCRECRGEREMVSAEARSDARRESE